ncbi:unnamed protein product [Closterium sp. Yama58-4]|nr:unnamed protein product [Closterium sp. Yama58-4]
MASSRFAFLAASLAVLILATSSCAFARIHAAPVVKPLVCKASSLKSLGYTKSVQLTSGVTLHWSLTAAKDGINAAILANKGSGGEKGWISVGWTATRGKMCNSEVVVGNLPAPNAVQAYKMTNKVFPSAGIQTTTDVALSATSVTGTTPAGGKIVKFTRTGAGNLAPVNYTGINNLIWAFAKTQAFGYHSKRGSAVVNFGC